MRVSKHLHSCLLVEEQDKTIIIDPGVFSYEEKALDINSLNKLDYILITHEHNDHFHPPFVKELVNKFPDVKIISNPSVVAILEKEGIKSSSEGDDFVKLTQVKHERVFDREVPLNVLFEVGNKLAHPGDSMSFTTDKEVLALPLLGAAWMVTQAVEKAIELEPKVIIPIHDWAYKDAPRKVMYQRLKEFFEAKGIDFKPLETGEIVEV